MNEKESAQVQMSYHRYCSLCSKKNETPQRAIMETQFQMSYHRHCSLCSRKSETPQRAIMEPQFQMS